MERPRWQATLVNPDAKEKDRRAISVTVIRGWLAQIPNSILKVTGLGDTQKQLETVDRLGPKQRPATVDVIAKQLGIVTERLQENPALLPAEHGGAAAAGKAQMLEDPARPTDEGDPDVSAGGPAEAPSAADGVAEGEVPPGDEAAKEA